MLAGIATALGCTVADLDGTTSPVVDRDVAAARSWVPAIRQALLEIDGPGSTARAFDVLAHEADLIRHLWQRCDYVGASRLLPDLIRDLHVSGPDAGSALRLLCDVAGVASSMLRSLGYPADSWIAAECCQAVAEAVDDPVLLGYAAFCRAMAVRSCGSQTRCLKLAEDGADDLRSRLGRPGAMDVLGMLHLACAAAAHRLNRPEDTTGSIARAADIARRTTGTNFFGMNFSLTNVRFWQIGIDADGGDAEQAITLARTIDPTVVRAPQRQVYFYLDVARACTRQPGHDPQATRYLINAERVAPQHVRASGQTRDLVRAILARNDPRQPSTSVLRGLSERLGST